MNRAQRRRLSRHNSTRRIRNLDRRVDTTGQPGRVSGLNRACIDCGADGDLVLLPGRRAIGQIWHYKHCPAATGITTWRPHPINEDQING